MVYSAGHTQVAVTQLPCNLKVKTCLESVGRNGEHVRTTQVIKKGDLSARNPRIAEGIEVIEMDLVYIRYSLE